MKKGFTRKKEKFHQKSLSPDICFTTKFCYTKKNLFFYSDIYFWQKGRRERYVGKERKVGKVGTGIVRKVPNTFKLVHMAPHVSKWVQIDLNVSKSHTFVRTFWVCHSLPWSY